jgi:hypothetical protein
MATLSVAMFFQGRSVSEETGLQEATPVADLRRFVALRRRIGVRRRSYSLHLFASLRTDRPGHVFGLSCMAGVYRA